MPFVFIVFIVFLLFTQRREAAKIIFKLIARKGLASRADAKKNKVVIVV